MIAMLSNPLKWSLVTSAMLLALTWMATCAPVTRSSTSPTGATPAQSTPSGAARQRIDLPPARLQGEISLEEALAGRRSVREFSTRPLTDVELGQLLWAAQGLTHLDGYRTAPSAGALYPLEIYAITPEGAYHYQPADHHLTLQATGDLRPALYIAALRQESVLEAPAMIAIAAVYERTERKYGRERSPRYVHLEAGHAAQNVLLQAVALELGAVPVGAFYDDEVARVLALPEDQQPLYLILVGQPGVR